MYALQTVGSTTSSVKDDTEVLELDDNGNSIVDQIISTSNNIKRTGKLTENGYQSSQSHPAIHIKERDDDGEPQPAGLCFWALFQAVGITCVATIICRSVLYSEGYFDTSFKTESTSITKEQYANWHYSLTIIGFVYLYANSIFMVKHDKSNVTLPYIMLHTFAYLVSALGLFATYMHKGMGKPITIRSYSDHLYSVHSWTGIFAAVLFTLQWLTAIVTFVMPCLHRLGLPLGKTFSLYTVLVSTICVVSGINDRTVKSPKEEINQFSIDSLVLNGFGMLVIVFLFLVVHLVTSPNKK